MWPGRSPVGAVRNVVHEMKPLHHSLFALALLLGTTAGAQRQEAPPSGSASSQPVDGGQVGPEASSTTARPGGVSNQTPEAAGERSGEGVVIGRPQSIGRPETIGSPQAVGRPQVIGGAASQVEGRTDDSSGPPASVSYGDYSGAGDSFGGSAGVVPRSEPLDPGVVVSPMTEADRAALESATELSGEDQGEWSTDGEWDHGGNGEWGDADLDRSGTSMVEPDPDAPSISSDAQPEPESLDNPSASSAVPPIQEVVDPEDEASWQTAPGLILGPTQPATGAMLGTSPTLGALDGTATGGSGAQEPQATDEEAPMREALESIESSNVRSEELQTQQLEALENLATQSELEREAQEAHAASVSQTQGDSMRALGLVDEASGEVMRGETDLSDVLGRARTSVVAAAEEAASRGDRNREDQLGRALLWIDAARVSAQNHDGVEAMRRLEEARFALNGIVPAAGAPIDSTGAPIAPYGAPNSY